ncbi:MAG: ornithine racemase Orr [Filifactoraceae bacterium]
MMYPRLVVDLKKIKDNLIEINSLVKKADCSLTIVTKSFCADTEIVRVLSESAEVDYLADSRIENIISYALSHKPKILLRLPMECEIEDVVKYTDISFNSELKTIELLNKEASKQNKIHKILLMIDLGDLREGIFYQYEEQVYNAVEQILSMKNIEFYGIGVNLTCYGAIIPKSENLSVLVDYSEKIQRKFGIKLHMVSGGNSSSIYLINKGELPKGINNLRPGEAFILGNETAYGEKLSETHNDAVILEAQIIELKEKPSLPIGEVGLDAFGKKPEYEDRGIIKRGIIGIGKQDIDIESMTTIDTKIDILGASSDHMILDLTNSDNCYKVGDIVSFKLGYGGLLKAFTSNYVVKTYK